MAARGEAVLGPGRPLGTQKPVLDVTGGRGRLSRESLRELWIFREVLWAFALRQIKVKYKQAAVGIGWAVLQPVVSAALFALFFGRFAGVASEGVPYLLFALAGMVAWTYFSSSGGTAMESLITDQALLRKVYFPREVLPLSAVVAGLIDLVPGLLTLLVVAGLYGIAPSIAWIALPLPILILILAASALGVGLSGLNVYYRDVRYALPFVLQLGLIVTPVVYSLDAIPEQWQTVYGILNPVAGAIDAIRRIVTHQEWPDLAITGGAIAWSALLLLLAYALFKRLERGFSDRV
jgi:ABC-type polysaccharide/polyol phosphate export permease